MIVVTGATGALNGATVEHLLQLVPADRVAVSARDAAKAQHFADRGVRVRQGSYDDPVALRDSFAGAEQVLLVSSNDPAADVVGQHRTAIDAAVDAGARRILYTSQQGAVGGPYPPAAAHAATESLLADSGVAWTALRYGFFGDLGLLLGPWQRTGVIAEPADGPIPWTDRADLAEAAAVILAGERTFDGPVTLSAPAATLDDFAGIASELTGRTIERVVVGDEDWVARRIADGTPEFLARMTLSLFRAARGGHFAGSAPMLAELLGRAPRTAAEQLADHITI
ncbi:NAD(P)H-binding protein [Saccharopolyspora sp. NFXS83]|uniref:NAD(P)H-binding protein n=1 Tax=Saccharopolyspora sp. NFXS83 TaxID=2993560 RepID=UPI00224AFE4E|nr:NAD(P)H-binding protein [Saccharopolyspora sp. NFXS83]MCX2732624.1 NAD(P)H-binding protein [Saccharopolyspora sp. NFXS83]